MNCPYCQSHLADDQRFCPNCGKEQPQKEAFCSNCGSPIISDGDFCTNCGFGIRNKNTGQQTPVQTPPASVPQPVVQKNIQPSGSAKTRGGFARVLKITGAIAAILLILIIGVSLFSDSSSIDLGEGEIKVVERNLLINTAEWGEVPANQVIVVMKDGYAKSDADQLAAAMGGTVVGFFEYLNLFQIETAARNENDLIQTISMVRQDARVELAVPNQQVFMDTTIYGVRCDSLDAPLYNEDNRGKGYEIAGVQRAWDLIKTSGFKTNDVHVGIVDDGLYKGKKEFDGKVKFEFPDANADLKNPEKNNDGTDKAHGSHGTAVATILAADPDNGGLTGIASNLGSNLKVSMVNNFAPPYGVDQVSTPDPNDPTKVVCSDGKTYALGDLMALKKQIDSGATIINCSWGNSNADPAWAAIYKKFFEKMAVEHKEVLFVCSAGNDGNVQDGRRRFPSGLALPNMITVGNIMNDGTNTASSNMASANFEVTLAAPGEQSIHGIGDDATIVNDYGGTSMATPHVTAAAAMLRSLNPKLSAGDIKKILVETVSPGVSNDGYSTAAPKELGAGILAIDKAVLRVINDLRAEKSQPALTMEEALQPGKVELIAEGGPQEYTITANIGGVGKGGTDVTIELQGSGSIGGLSKQHLSSDGTLTWNVILSGDSGTVHVKRLDTNSCWNVKLPPDLAGTWVGSFKVENWSASEGFNLAYQETGLTVVFDERKDSNTPLTGTAKLEHSYAAKITGSLNGRRISFRIVGDPSQVFFSGEIVGGAIEGTWNGHQESGDQYFRANGNWFIQRQ